MRLADRGASAYFWGWKAQKGEFSSGVTQEDREEWKTILYVKQKQRYWTVGENLGRSEGIEGIMNAPGPETATSRRIRASETYGTINGPPLAAKYMTEFPEVLLIRFIIAIFHAKIHFCTHVISKMLHWMAKYKSPGFKTLCNKLDNQRDNLEHGKLSTNATGLFTLSRRYVLFFEMEMIPFFFSELPKFLAKNVRKKRKKIQNQFYFNH